MREPRPHPSEKTGGTENFALIFLMTFFFFFLLKSGMLPNANRIVQTEC